VNLGKNTPFVFFAQNFSIDGCRNVYYKYLKTVLFVCYMFFAINVTVTSVNTLLQITVMELSTED